MNGITKFIAGLFKQRHSGEDRQGPNCAFLRIYSEARPCSEGSEPEDDADILEDLL